MFFPFLGSKSVNSITAPMLLTVVRRIEERGAKEVAKRVLQLCGQVFRYGVATGQCERDPSGDLKGALAPHTPKPQAAITDKREVAKLLRSFDEFKGSFVVLCALKFSAYTFCRPGEIRKAEWAEFNLEEAIWDIPAPKMKMKKPHRVPIIPAGGRITSKSASVHRNRAICFPLEPDSGPANVGKYRHCSY